MLLEKRGIVRDQIHGFIEINNLEYLLMQHQFLRRLHGIKQLGMANLVFPGATHTRFNHSLGVMHIAGQIADRLLDIARKGRFCGHVFLHCARGMEQFVETARLAGLLHDIGHPPLSHQLEDSLHVVSRLISVRENRPSPMDSIIAEYGEGKLHEAFTKHFVQRIVEDLESTSLHEEAYYLRAAGAVLGSFGPDQLEYIGLSSEAVSLLGDIISNEVFDADRLDYLMRDAVMSGVVFGTIDIDRLLVGLQIVEEDGRLRIGVHPRSLQTVEDVFDARFKMYKTIYYHHKSIAINIAITRVVDLLFQDWDDLAPKPLLDGLEGPYDLYNPRRIADLILEGRTLYTDSDFDLILYNMSTSKKEAHKRWARALLHERRLLPVSLVKRPESLVINILENTNIKNNNILDTINLIYKSITSYAQSKRSEFESMLKERLYESMRREIPRLDPDAIQVDIDPKPVIRGDLSRVLKMYKSLYLHFISQIGRISLVFAYVYSDSEKIHQIIYNNRAKLRRIYTIFLSDIIKDYLSR